MTAFSDSFHPEFIIGDEVVIELLNFKIGAEREGFEPPDL
jgi:hypothetical protein